MSKLTEHKNEMRTRRTAASIALAACALAICIGLPGTAWTGSVFMKNGYIIQGPIVERSDNVVILGWPHGKMTIHRRFIDAVVFEQDEERRLKEEEALAQREATPIEVASILDTQQPEGDELPPDVDSLIKKYVIETKSTKSPTEGEGATDPAASAAGGESTTDVVAQPEHSLGERVSVQELACSLRPPKGWASVKKGDAFHVQAAEETDGFRPCLNVVSVPRNATTGGNYVSWVKEEDSKALQDFELISEGPTKLGSLQAVEIVCRGTRNERTATVRQLVVENENRVWIVSAFTHAEGADAVAGALAESLKSFEVSGTK